MPTESFDAEISESRMLAPMVKSFTFTRKDQRPLGHAPGQWVNLVLPLPGGEIRRAYSIASAPDDSPHFEVAVTHVTDGPGSGFLCGLEAGATLRAIGPQGFFTRHPTDASPSLFVATGTGVTPLRSMLRAALTAGSKAPLWLLLGARCEEDLLYREELDALTQRHESLQVHYTLSRGEAAWGGRRGYVQEHVPELWKALGALAQGQAQAQALQPSAPHLYVCGLERMVKAVRELARGPLETPRERVHSERYD